MRVAVNTASGIVIDMNLPATPAWEGDEPWDKGETLAAVFLSPSRHRAVVQLHSSEEDEEVAAEFVTTTFLLMEGPNLDQLRIRFPVIEAALNRACAEDL